MTDETKPSEGTAEPEPPKPADKPAGLDDATKQSIREVVQEELAKVTDLLVGKKDDVKPATEAPQLNAANIAKMAEDAVKAAAEKLGPPKHKPEPKPDPSNGDTAPPKKDDKEAAPKTVRKLTKALWGDDDR